MSKPGVQHEGEASLKKIMAKALRESTVVIARGYTDAEIEAIKAEARRAERERWKPILRELIKVTTVLDRRDKAEGITEHSVVKKARAAILALPDNEEGSA